VKARGGLDGNSPPTGGGANRGLLYFGGSFGGIFVTWGVRPRCKWRLVGEEGKRETTAEQRATKLPNLTRPHLLHEIRLSIERRNSGGFGIVLPIIVYRKALKCQKVVCMGIVGFL